MPVAPKPLDEFERVKTLQTLGIMGTPAEERFDKVTRLAKRLFNVPMVLVDLVDSTRVWLKSVQGCDLVLASREDSYCQYAVSEGTTLQITDAMVDPRVIDNPHAASIRSYLGEPLKYDGFTVGVFCLCDYKPRTFDAEEISLFKDLAQIVEQEIHVTRLSEVQVRLARENEVLSEKATVDGLTRVWNRSSILEIAERESSWDMGLLSLDVDFFKQVNDKYGHAGGDTVLRIVAERVRQSLRSSDALGRVGGEEFLIVVKGAANLLEIGNRIRESIASDPIHFDGHTLSVTVSIGGTFVPAANNTPGKVAEALRQADLNLYRAKETGRNRVIL